jgi:hypothetical protein
MVRRFTRRTPSPAPFIAAALLFVAGTSPAQECLDCHPDIAGQFNAPSHHIQGVKASSDRCYACHWEAAADGTVDPRYHQKDSSRIDLVIRVDATRPTEYRPGSTAVVYSRESIGTPAERGALGDASRHCLGCHNDRNNAATPFNDGKSPRQYAWDGQSVASRYENRQTTAWGKYSTQATNKKSRINKAFSAHGNAPANQGGWSAGSGYDGDILLSRGGARAKNVECLDCHNSHGSSVPGTTTSYRSAEGGYTGGILKQTVAGRGGYAMTYTPAANPDNSSPNPYSAGAGLCFDCHETAAAGNTPWGYRSTFGATEPVIGYKDTPRLGTGVKGSTARYSDRQSRTAIASSHLKSGKMLTYSSHGEIRGLCTPCHDPHGVSPTLGEKMAYAVPLLKGSWLTSPYREDGPPAATPQKAGDGKGDGTSGRGIAWEKGDFSFTNREMNANFGVSGGGAPREPMSRSGMKYNVDRNTFGAGGRITEGDDRFAGLCLSCHSKERLTGTDKIGRIHRTVKGWGNNKEHSFPCSKCHQAHNSGLPRLMQTNCFEVGPPGLRESSGLAWMPEQKPGKKTADGKDKQKQASSKGKKSGKEEIVGCHVRQFGGNPSKQGGGEWNEKSKW